MSARADLSSLPPSHPLFGPILKVERAERHVEEVKREVDAFIKRSPYEVRAYDNEETGDRLYRVHIREGVPAYLSAPIGDAIHNLRAAFDLIACRIVELGAGDIAQAAFPVFKVAKHFEARGLAKIKGAPKHAARVVERLQPYHGGDNKALWLLHQLDILDKHRMIIPVGSAYRSVGLNLNAMFGLLLKQMGKETPVGHDFGFVHIKPADRQFPLQDGAIVFGVPAEARDTPIDDNPQFAFDIAFGEGQVAEGEPIVPTLAQLVQFTRGAIQTFADEVFT